MNSWAKWTAKTVLVTAGFAAAGGGFAGVAYAGTGGTNAGNLSILGGNQVSAPVSVPVDLCGNAAAVLGIATAGCQGGAEVLAHRGPAAKVQIPVRIAANICGNAIGHSQAACQGGVELPGSPAGSASGPIRHAGLSAGNVSVGSGNQVKAPVSVPANVCGNAVAVLGGSNAGCEGGATIGDRPRGNRDLLSSAQLAGLGTLPGLANLPTLAGVTQRLANGGSPLSSSALSALSSNVNDGGMSGNSFATLAIGALLAGAAALKLAGRRSRARKASAGEVPA
jgi:hypothetical protein